MFVMSLDLANTKNNEKTCAGELKTIWKIFSVEYLTILIQIMVIYYQKMKAKTIFGLRQASYSWLWQSEAPPPRKGLKSIRQQVVQQMRQRDQMPLTNPL